MVYLSLPSSGLCSCWEFCKVINNNQQWVTLFSSSVNQEKIMCKTVSGADRGCNSRLVVVFFFSYDINSKVTNLSLTSSFIPVVSCRAWFIISWTHKQERSLEKLLLAFRNAKYQTVRAQITANLHRILPFRSKHQSSDEEDKWSFGILEIKNYHKGGFSQREFADGRRKKFLRRERDRDREWEGERKRAKGRETERETIGVHCSNVTKLPQPKHCFW